MNICTILTLTMAFGLVGAIASPRVVQSEPYESYYLYLGNHPKAANPGYHEDVQGVTHDDNYWYITQSDKDEENGAHERALWKIPVTHNLKSVSPDGPGIKRISLDHIPDLGGRGYDHFGDLSYYYNKDYDKEGYLVIPVEDLERDYERPNSLIAIFRARDLEYMGCVEVPPWDDGDKTLGWVAVDPEGYLYTSGKKVTKCYKFSLSWDTVPYKDKELKLEKVGEFPFLDEFGNPLILTHIQGGVFSESGNLLYIVSGLDDKHYANDGISVFDTQTHRRVQQSTNGKGYFNYEFGPGGWSYQEPEGLTIWDLDDGRAPGISGQLHVFMLDNDWPSADEVYFKHYTHTIYVDRRYSGREEGTPTKPFNTISEANDYAWNGAQIKIQAGSYPETLTFSKRVKVLSKGGTVVIGK